MSRNSIIGRLPEMGERTKATVSCSTAHRAPAARGGGLLSIVALVALFVTSLTRAPEPAWSVRYR
ncbi:MAG: hypothetical protein ACRDUV_07290 [Pseudonocardiaceae bacterium]